MTDEVQDERLERKKIAGATSKAVNFKWVDPTLLDEGFVPFPKRLLRCMSQIWAGDKEIEQLAALLAIVDYRRPGQTRPPSVGLLAFLAGLEPKEFETRLEELKTAGLVDYYGSPAALQISLDRLVGVVKQRTSGAE